MGYKYNYRFLFETSQLSHSLIGYLLRRKFFVSELDKVMDEKHDISDDDIYEILKTVYYPMWRSQRRTSDTSVLYKSLSQYSKIKFGDPSVWEQEFIELDESGATEY